MITIFSTDKCPRCMLLKAAFQNGQIAYEEAILDATILARCLCETSVWVQSAPLVLVGSVWYFSDDLFSPSSDLFPNWKDILDGNRPHKKDFSGIGGQPSSEKQECSQIWGPE